jgi:hypothetical protein
MDQKNPTMEELWEAEETKVPEGDLDFMTQYRGDEVVIEHGEGKQNRVGNHKPQGPRRYL